MDSIPIIREMQIKTKMKYCFAPIGIAVINKNPTPKKSNRNSRQQMLVRTRKLGTIIHYCWLCKIVKSKQYNGSPENLRELT